MLFEDIVNAVVTQGGFDTASDDVSTATVQGWVNEVYKEVVAESKWMMAVETLAVTVAGTAAYDLPDTVVDVLGLALADSSGNPGDWQPVGLEDLWALQRGDLGLRGSGGVFAQTAKADSTKQIQLFPAPTTSGALITAMVALVPADLVNGVTPAVPADVHGRLIDAAIALALLRIEKRPDLAQPLDARKQEIKDILVRRRNSRAGSGSTRIRVQGIDF
ncbi:hypothetical protein DSM104299_03230 [Baekduia alba]|uniref:phage adaptor protein n=1 Tax=Baekduia alba TaxID=2997333 RepID=UPI002341BF7B|nr:hypothetical protein [Baekduia alba]WCB94493.1 hypothetical protein DSM104299_03230 [Baekduia alba]